VTRPPPPWCTPPPCLSCAPSRGDRPRAAPRGGRHTAWREQADGKLLPRRPRHPRHVPLSSTLPIPVARAAGGGAMVLPSPRTPPGSPWLLPRLHVVASAGRQPRHTRPIFLHRQPWTLVPAQPGREMWLPRWFFRNPFFHPGGGAAAAAPEVHDRFFTRGRAMVLPIRRHSSSYDALTARRRPTVFGNRGKEQAVTAPEQRRLWTHFLPSSHRVGGGCVDVARTPWGPPAPPTYPVQSRTTTHPVRAPPEPYPSGFDGWSFRCCLHTGPAADIRGRRGRRVGAAGME